MNEEIFRKKSLDKVKSPESLDDYIQVSNPRVWLLIFSIIILLIGACVWGIFGHINSTIPATVQVDNESAVCYVAESDITSVQVGLTVKFAEKEATIISIGEKKAQGYICTLSTSENLATGFYEGKVIVESYKPLSFVFN